MHYKSEFERHVGYFRHGTKLNGKLGKFIRKIVEFTYFMHIYKLSFSD